jgi:hypothetical protein
VSNQGVGVVPGVPEGVPFGTGVDIPPRFMLRSSNVLKFTTVPLVFKYVPVIVSPGCTSGSFGESDRLAVKITFCPAI